MRVNGKTIDQEAIPLLEYLRREGYGVDHVVVELGREIVTRERFGEVTLEPEDDVNILQFMGGG